MCEQDKEGTLCDDMKCHRVNRTMKDHCVNRTMKEHCVNRIMKEHCVNRTMKEHCVIHAEIDDSCGVTVTRASCRDRRFLWLDSYMCITQKQVILAV